MKQAIFSLLLTAILLPACSRQAEKTELKDAPVVLGPTAKDTRLAMKPLTPEERLKALRLEGEMDTASYLRLIESLGAVSRQQRSSRISRVSTALMNKYLGQNVHRTKFSESLYTQTMIGEGEPEAMKELKEISVQITKAADTFAWLLNKSRKSFPWPAELKSYDQAVSTIDSYARWLIDAIPSLKLGKGLDRPLSAAVETEYLKFRPDLVQFSQEIQAANGIGQALSAVNRALDAFEIEMSAEQRAEFKKGEDLAASLTTVQDSQGALTVIIQVWRMVPPEEREAVFKEAAPEFYDFLNGKSEGELDCLAQSVCLNPILEVARRLFILPKITEFGVEKIKVAIDTAGRDYVVSQVLKEATSLLPQIPDLIKEKVVAEAKKYKALVGAIQKDFPGYARKHIRAWETKSFPQGMRGLEPARIKVKIPSSSKAQVALSQLNGGGVRSGAEALGVSLALAHAYLPEAGSEAMKAALVEPILKILSVTGFRMPGGGLFPSLLLPLNAKKTEVFDIKDLLKGSTAYAVPDLFVASNNMVMNRKAAPADASVSAQAELLRGLSRQIKFHRDWEKNTFDDHLGPIQVEDMMTDVPKGALNLSAFPKEMIFTLAVGGAGAVLQNVVRSLSPAFLILPDGKLLWGDKYKEIGENGGNISTVAGMVDIKGGKRGDTVHTADVARYILALDEFLGATEGIEQTKSPLLNEKNAEGRTVLDELQEARRYLRLFQMALTNYLVYVAQDKDGGFRPTYTLGEMNTVVQKPVTERRLLDQALAIRALMASARRLELSLFSWAALDAYYFMNKTLWDSASQFYASGVAGSGERMGKAGILEITEVLRAVEELSPRMPTDVRAQWERASGPWVEALGAF